MSFLSGRHRGILTLATEVASLIQERHFTQTALCRRIEERLAALVRTDDWLEEQWRTVSPTSYRRTPLHEDPAGRFSIGCFVWAPGQFTPIHDHRSWGVIGVLQTGIAAVNYRLATDGTLTETSRSRLPAGATTFVNAEIGDIHKVGNPSPFPAITIHVYGTTFANVCKSQYSPPRQTEQLYESYV